MYLHGVDLIHASHGILVDDTVDMDNMDDTSMDSMDYSHDMDDMDEIICCTYCIPSIDKLINHNFNLPAKK